MATPSGYKPSPLGYGSPRASPFRRPQSPASPSTLRQTTPSASPTKPGLSENAPRFTSSPATSPIQEFRTSRGPPAPVMDDVFEPPVPQHRSVPRTGSTVAVGQGNALSQLQPSQVRTMREAFQILDRDSDGAVNREDVADMLNQLGLPSTPADVSHFFPPSAAQTMTMAMFLNSISTSLAALSPSSELLSAFSAFDDDDGGQIDIDELRDALLHTAPEPGQQPLTARDVDKVINGFTGRRAFSKSKVGKRGEVFRYQDFVNTINGKNGGGGGQAAEDAEDA